MNLVFRGSFASAFLAIACATPVEAGSFIRDRVETLAPLPEGARRTNIELRSANNAVLRGWLVHKTNSQRTVLLFHGNGQGILSSMWSIYWFAEAFDADVLALDARGFGFSDGTPSIDGSIADSLRIYDRLRELYPKPRPVIVIGQSMGTASAIHVAANRQADLLVLLSPFSSLDDVLDAYRDKAPWYVQLRVDSSLSEIRSSPTSDLRRVVAPTLIVRGTDDQLSTEAVVARVVRACNAKVKEVCAVRGKHDDVHATNSEVRGCIERFAARTVTDVHAVESAKLGAQQGARRAPSGFPQPLSVGK